MTREDFKAQIKKRLGESNKRIAKKYKSNRPFVKIYLKASEKLYKKILKDLKKDIYE